MACLVKIVCESWAVRTFIFWDGSIAINKIVWFSTFYAAFSMVGNMFKAVTMSALVSATNLPFLIILFCFLTFDCWRTRLTSKKRTCWVIASRYSRFFVLFILITVYFDHMQMAPITSHIRTYFVIRVYFIWMLFVKKNKHLIRDCDEKKYLKMDFEMHWKILSGRWPFIFNLQLNPYGYRWYDLTFCSIFCIHVECSYRIEYMPNNRHNRHDSSIM